MKDRHTGLSGGHGEVCAALIAKKKRALLEQDPAIPAPRVSNLGVILTTA